MNSPTDQPQPISRPPAGPTRRLPATSEEWEQLRRSVAMLQPGAWALRREPALAALDVVLGRRQPPPPVSAPE